MQDRDFRNFSLANSKLLSLSIRANGCEQKTNDSAKYTKKTKVRKTSEKSMEYYIDVKFCESPLRQFYTTESLREPSPATDP